MLNVPLWNELNRRVKKSPPEILHPYLRSITAADPLKIHQADKQIRRWYLADVSLADEVIGEKALRRLNPTNENNIAFLPLREIS